MRSQQVTTYPEINYVLDRLLTRVQAVLGPRFLALYLYGSLATGDFEPGRSDIDFVVVTDGELPAELISQLGAMHAHLTLSDLPWAKKLEGAYLPASALRRYNPEDPPRPTLHEGRFYMDRQASDWVLQRHVLREHGVVVAGPPPADLIDPVQPGALREAVRAILEEWWAPRLTDPTHLESHGYPAYTVLTMCRALHTLEHGVVATKAQAAAWACSTLEDRWSPMIALALVWPEGDREIRLEDTLDLIRYTLERSRSSKSG